MPFEKGRRFLNRRPFVIWPTLARADGSGTMHYWNLSALFKWRHPLLRKICTRH